MSLGLFAPSLAMAADPKADIKCGANIAAGEDCNAASSGNDLGGLAETIINILSVLIGAVAVIVLMFGGFRYVTSAGNDASVQSAKKTIIYALVGLIVVALAQVIVKFVLTSVSENNASTSSASRGECQRTRAGAFWIGGPNHGKPC